MSRSHWALQLGTLVSNYYATLFGDRIRDVLDERLRQRLESPATQEDIYPGDNKCQVFCLDTMDQAVRIVMFCDLN